MKRWAIALVTGLTMATLVWAGDAAKKPVAVELTGALGCGHCAFHKTKQCAAAFKTADGKLYVIDNATKDVMEARFKGGTIKVTGQATEQDGLLHVQASKQELVK